MNIGGQWEDAYRSISPAYMMELVGRLQTALENGYPDPDDLHLYLDKWHEDYDGFGDEQNFRYVYDKQADVDLKRTLHEMPPELVVRIAIDLGVDTPGFIPSMPSFRNVLKEQNPNAQAQFERAVRNVMEQPDLAVSSAYSTLESVLKTIGKDESLGIEEDLRKTVGKKLISAVIPKLGLRTGKEVPTEINQMCNGLISACIAITDLRNDKSDAHGSAPNDYVIDDPLWAELVVNATATVGLFLWEFYQRTRSPQRIITTHGDDEIPF